MLGVFQAPVMYLLRGTDDGVAYNVPTNAVGLLFRELLVLVSLPVFPLAPALALLMSVVTTNSTAAMILGILPSSRRAVPFGAGPVFFKRVMLVALVFAVVPTAYFAAVRTPGPCGPYRGQPHMFHVVTGVVNTLPAWLRGTCYYIASAGFAYPATLLLAGVIVWLYARSQRHARALLFLRRWSSVEREDIIRTARRKDISARRRRSLENETDPGRAR
jgi:hypothetical protein